MSTMSALPIKDLLFYINEARTNPKKFSEYIKKELDSFIDDTTLPLKPNCNYSTFEGRAGWTQAYEHMKNLKPLYPYQLNEGLNLAAMDHATDMKINQFFDHQSSNGMSFNDRIERRCGKINGNIFMAENLGTDFDEPGRNHPLQTIMGLIIDDGVSNRGHRKNLLSDKYKYCGIFSIKTDERFQTCIKFHSENLKVLNNSKQPLTEDTSNNPPKSPGYEDDFHKQQPSNLKSNSIINSQKQIQGEKPFNDWSQKSIQGEKPFNDWRGSLLSSRAGEKSIKSKKTNIKTSKFHDKTIRITTIKIVYTDGSVEEQINEEIL